jgi:hypothetical protein
MDLATTMQGILDALIGIMYAVGALAGWWSRFMTALLDVVG